MRSIVIKTKGSWTLTKVSELSYFKNGRANMHMASRYHIECENTDVNSVTTGCFNIPTKKQALKIWIELFKTHSLGGATLRSELFRKEGA